jgi:hypothetical protein
MIAIEGHWERRVAKLETLAATMVTLLGIDCRGPMK